MKTDRTPPKLPQLPAAVRRSLRRSAQHLSELLREFLRFLRLGITAGVGALCAASPAALHADPVSRLVSDVARAVDASALADAAVSDALTESMQRRDEAETETNTKRRWFVAVPIETSELKAQPGQSGARFDTSAAVVGFSWPQSNAPRLTVAAGAFTQEGKIGRDGLRIDHSGFGLLLIGERQWGAWELRAQVGSTASQLKTRHPIGSIASGANFRGKTDGIAHQGAIALERAVRFGEGAVRFSGGFRYHTAEFDPLAERGAVVGAHNFRDLERDSLRGFLGARIIGQEWQLGSFHLRASGLLQLENEFADRELAITSNGDVAPQERGIATSGRRLHGVSEPRLTLTADNGITASLSYRAGFDGKDFEAHAFRLNVSRRF